MSVEHWCTRGRGSLALGIAAAAVAFTNPSERGIQTAAGCSGSAGYDDWVEVRPSGATETWSLDGFHFWVGVPSGWSDGGPGSLDDLPNTQIDVTDAEGNVIPGQLGFYKIRRQAVALTWRADTDLPEGSTLHSKLVLGQTWLDPERTESRDVTLTVADAAQPFELPEITDSWITETWTEGPSADCGNGGCTGIIGVDKVSALTWRLGWSVPSTAPWSLELVMTQGNAGRPLGPQWVGHQSWSAGAASLHVEGADEYCFKMVGTDFSTGTTLTSEEVCSEPGVPEEEVFTDLERLNNCVYPPEDDELRELWCENRSLSEACGGPTGSGGSGTGGTAGNGGNSSAVGSGGSNTSGDVDTSDSTSTHGSGGSPNAGGSGGSAGNAGGSGGSAGNADTSGGDEPEPRLSKGGCWCSVPQAPAASHDAFALGGLALLGLRRRWHQRSRR